MFISSCEVVSDLLQIYVLSLYVHIYTEEIAVAIYLNSEKSICLWFIVCACFNGHHCYWPCNAFLFAFVAVLLAMSDRPGCLQFFGALMFDLLSCCSGLNLHQPVKVLTWTRCSRLLEIQNDGLPYYFLIPVFWLDCTNSLCGEWQTRLWTK